jgi:hypothetical protein
MATTTREHHMDVIKKMQPGQPGTKRYTRQYGESLVCVRYRRDATNSRRVTTVELIVDDGFYHQDTNPIIKTMYPSPNRNVYIRVGYEETWLRMQIKVVGARWVAEKKLWIMRYREVEKLGITERIIEDEKDG